VLLPHGGQDRAVPFGHGQWLASRISGVEARFFDEEGHALREDHIEDVHAWLIDRSFDLVWIAALDLVLRRGNQRR
jgi:predicted esterase